MKTNQRWLAVTLLCVAVMSLCIVFLSEGVDAGKLLNDARKDLRAGRFQFAEENAIKAITEDATLVEAYLIAGEAAARDGRIEASVAHYRSGAELEKRPQKKAQFYFYAGESCVQNGRLLEAESLFQAAIKAAPGHVLAEDRLEFIYRTEGRASESIALLQRRAASDTASVEQLLNLGHPYGDRKFPPELLKLMPQLEKDVLPTLTLAKELLAEGNRQLAEKRLRRIIAKFPEVSSAQGELGELLLDGDEKAFVDWFAQLPDSCREVSQIWMVRGLWAERNLLWLEAATGFLNCVSNDPFNRSAVFHLAIAFGHLGNQADAESCREQSRKLEVIERLLNDIHSNKQPRESVLKLIPLLNAVGRSTESRNWLRHARMQFRDAPELLTLPSIGANEAAELQRWQSLLQGLNATESAEPVPKLLSTASKTDLAAEGQPASSRISFSAASRELGIEFEFVNLPPSQGHKKMVQSNGGGIGVIDIDADGWADLYFTQGGIWPSTPPSTGPSDKVFRNLGGKRFQDVAGVTGAFDCDFGQGVTVGDINCDGFDEIYVANVGSNRLFRNNGDGTLSDITAESELAANEWSTSCALNDFDLDGNLDLYVVNYLSLQDAAAEICHEGSQLTSCRPEGNIAAEDRLYLNLGNDRFSEISGTSNIQQPNGRGMGIISADFDGDHYPDIFIGNDAVPNFLFLNRSDLEQSTQSPEDQRGSGKTPDSLPIQASNKTVQFEESAFQRGIATDGSGQSLASMGIAFADFNGDRHNDVFVTNFYNEPNTMYLGQTNGMFVDRTRSLQLAQPSIPMLGFGTQAIDADLDGDQDIVVLNGHLDDLSARGIPFQMRPQVFENQSGRWFVEPKLECPFFNDARIGRSLARLDWNNDGREDLAAGLLDSPYVMLTNTSTPAGCWLGLHLVGTTSSRNAIGAVVTVRDGDNSPTQQLASGSGFQASNQRRIVVAIPGKTQEKFVQITVRWQNGDEVVFHEVATNQSYIVVQPRPGTSRPQVPFLLPL